MAVRDLRYGLAIRVGSLHGGPPSLRLQQPYSDGPRTGDLRDSLPLTSRIPEAKKPRREECGNRESANAGVANYKLPACTNLDTRRVELAGAQAEPPAPAERLDRGSLPGQPRAGLVCPAASQPIDTGYFPRQIRHCRRASTRRVNRICGSDAKNNRHGEVESVTAVSDSTA